MAKDKKMSIKERYQYLSRMQRRYKKGTRAERTHMLNEMERHTGMHRKSLVRRMNSDIERKERKQERGKEYGKDVDEVLNLVWQALDYVCPERLTPNLVPTADLLALHQELQLPPTLRTQLGEISMSSVRRHLPPMPITHRKRKPKAPQNRFQLEIPAYRIPRDIAEPGHLELDLVHHCGDTLRGQYLYTLQVVDVATGWSGRHAILGRSYIVVADALHVLFQALPFPVHELHPDNGSEFLNDHLLTFLRQHYPQVQLSRSRPGHPNDNRLVEQKNDTLVRHYLGDRRYDTVTQTRFLSSIYRKMGDYYNYIQPVMKQIAKEWVPATDSRPGRVKRIHDDALPPVSRLCTYLSEDQQASLLVHRSAINPIKLRNEIYRDLDHLFAYPNAKSDEVQDIFQTLSYPELFPEALVALEVVTSLSDKEVA